MKSPASAVRRTSPRPKASAAAPQAAAPSGKIHPVVIYPFRPGSDFADLRELYALISRLNAAPDRFARPVTVIDRKTHFAAQGNPAYRDFRTEVVSQHSDVLDVWGVDTCQMWYSGLGHAWERGGRDDVYWLIPGDFNYASPAGRAVLGRLHDLPEICTELRQDLCIGEIATHAGHSKQLIDTYGTFALLYNWFPAAAAQIREYTERPRSEFFAVRHDFLGEILTQRWYPYEQTVVMLLKAVAARKRISRYYVGEITDLPEGRDSFASALQQIERTERVLKTLWRDQHQTAAGWTERYRQLANHSEQIRQGALTVLQHLLG